ncbi:MAG: heme biosynthesis protein HemY [Brucellaceae bacterium]|nr:heme biosynthesis protein HemY [Brucellaceae bacterium]
MFRILFFVVLVFALGLGFAWLAERPGELVVTFGGYQYQVTLMVAAVLVTAIVAAVMFTWWLVRGIWNSPYTIARYFRVRRRDRGYQALSTGMIAAGAGDAALARRMKQQAAKLISSDQEPLIHLLDAQTSLLEGNHDDARQKFEAMVDDPEMRILGLRGLFLEASRLGEREAARHYAARAAEIAPQLAWAAEATIEDRAADGDWDGALKLVDALKSTRQIDREAAARKRAVLLTAKAMTLIDSDPQAARTAALEAVKIEPAFAPAAIVAARSLFKQDDLRKGARILEAAWKAEPHPEVADVYIHARPGDSTGDRLARAKKLAGMRINNAESALAVARAALEADDFGTARESVETAIRIRPTESAYLILADIDEAESGDQGRVREALAKAVRAPRDPAWVADGQVSERWAPLSPVTGRLDAFEWRVPVERLGPMIEQQEGVMPPPGARSLAPPPPLAPASAVVDAEVAEEAETVIPAQEAPVEAPEPDTPEVAEPAAESKVPKKQSPPAEVAKDKHASDGGDKLAPPDDPGVDTDDESGTESRFRLF